MWGIPNKALPQLAGQGNRRNPCISGVQTCTSFAGNITPKRNSLWPIRTLGQTLGEPENARPNPPRIGFLSENYLQGKEMGLVFLDHFEYLGNEQDAPAISRGSKPFQIGNHCFFETTAYSNCPSLMKQSQTEAPPSCGPCGDLSWKSPLGSKGGGFSFGTHGKQARENFPGFL